MSKKNKKSGGELVLAPNAVTQTGLTLNVKNMLSTAVESYQDKQRAKVQRQVEVILERIECLLPMKRNTEMRIALCEQQLAAIKAGEFDVNPINLHIKFRSDVLNVAWDDTAYWGMSDPNEKKDPFRGF